MTVDSTYISNMSKYVVGADYTSSQLSQWLPICISRVNRENGSLSPAEFDYATGLLICHQIYLYGHGDDDSVSMSSGEESRTRMMDKDGMPTSPWMEQYKEIIKGRVVLPSTGVQRTDIDTSAAFRFSNQALPRPVFQDNTLRPPSLNQLDQ